MRLDSAVKKVVGPKNLDTFYLYNAAPPKKAHVPVKFVKLVSEMLSFHIVKLIQIIFCSYNSI